MSSRQILSAATALIVLSGCASLQGHEPASPGTVAPSHVTQDDKDVYFGAFGYADREAGRAMTRHTAGLTYCSGDNLPTLQA
jgi:hypothetical protein